MNNTQTIERNGREFVITISPDANVSRRFRVTVRDEDGVDCGYCALKPASNDYTRGYRITNYVVYGPATKGLGLGRAMVDFFEQWSGRDVIPSSAFGATGDLTRRGKEAARKRLEQTTPSWLPHDWKETFAATPILEGLIAVPETILNKALAFAAKEVLSWAMTVARPDQHAIINGLAKHYGCAITKRDITDKPVAVERLSADFSDLPDGYATGEAHDDLYIAVDWRPGKVAGGWMPKKRVVIIYPMSTHILRGFPRYEHSLADYLDSCETTLRHEFRHVVQSLLLHPAQSEKTYQTNALDKSAYHLSRNEFDPIIGSSIEMFVQLYRTMIEYGKKPNLGLMIKQYVGMAKPKFGERPEQFFVDLKKGDPERYRIAVKKFVSGVHELLMK